MYKSNLDKSAVSKVTAERNQYLNAEKNVYAV